MKNICDGVLLFGGEEAVVNYKNGLSAKSEMYSFGPKLSFGLLCSGLNDEEIKIAAYGFADDIILWEQKACTSCRLPSKTLLIEPIKRQSLCINKTMGCMHKKHRRFNNMCGVLSEMIAVTTEARQFSRTTVICILPNRNAVRSIIRTSPINIRRVRENGGRHGC